MSFVDTTSKEILSRKFIFFNADGLRKDSKSIEYDTDFQKNIVVLCVDTRLTNEKKIILDELAKNMIS